MKKMSADGLLNIRGHQILFGAVTCLSGYLQKEKYFIACGFFIHTSHSSYPSFSTLNLIFLIRLLLSSFMVLGIKPRTSYVLGNDSTTVLLLNL